MTPRDGDNATSGIRERLLRNFRDPEYRHAYLESFLNSLIAFQIRALRKRRGWSQDDLAAEMGTKQSAISRIEDPDYSTWKIETLRKAARAFDLALVVKFVSFGDAVDDIEQFGIDRLLRPEFAEDPVFIFGGESSINEKSATSQVGIGRGFATVSNLQEYIERQSSSVSAVDTREWTMDTPIQEAVHG
jgi:transcriptional regulator with XRE-family HTH domain